LLHVSVVQAIGARVWVNGCIIYSQQNPGNLPSLVNQCAKIIGNTNNAYYLGQFRRYCANTNAYGWIGNANCTTGFTPYPGMIPVQTVTPTISVSPTQGSSPTPTLTNTSTSTVTPSQRVTCTPTCTQTKTPTQTPTNTRTRSQTPTNTRTRSQTPTQTRTATQTATNTRTQTQTSTRTNTQTSTRTSSYTPTVTSTASNTPTVTSTKTYTNTVSNTATQGVTVTTTRSRTSSYTRTPTVSRTASLPSQSCLAYSYDISDTRSYVPLSGSDRGVNAYNLVDGQSADLFGIPGYTNYNNGEAFLDFRAGDGICIDNSSLKFNPVNGVTVAGWFKLTDVTQNNKLWTQWPNNTSHYVFSLGACTDCTLEFDVYNSSGQQLGYRNSTIPMLSSTDEVYHIAASYNPASGETKLYLNGVCRDGSTNSCADKTPRCSTCGMRIGSQEQGGYSGYTYFYSGGLYNCALTDSEISDLYYNKLFRYYPNVTQTPTRTRTHTSTPTQGSSPTATLTQYPTYTQVPNVNNVCVYFDASDANTHVTVNCIKDTVNNVCYTTSGTSGNNVGQLNGYYCHGYFNYGSSFAPNLSNFTADVWFAVNNTESQNPLWASWASSKWTLMMQSRIGQINFGVRDESQNDISAPVYCWSCMTCGAGDLVHAAFVYNATCGTNKLFINGSCVGGCSFTAGTRPYSNSGNLFLGLKEDTGTVFSGKLYKANFYREALSDTQVGNLYTCYKNKFSVCPTPTPTSTKTPTQTLTPTKGAVVPTSNLQLYVDATNTLSYPVSGGNVLFDISGNGVNGTISGATLTESTTEPRNFYFDGNDAITFSTTAISTDWTVTIVVKPENLTSDQYLFETSTSNGIATIVNYVDGKYNLYSNSVGYPYGNTPAVTEMDVNYGKYQVITWRRKDDQLYDYLDGVLTVNVPITYNESSFYPNATFRIGCI